MDANAVQRLLNNFEVDTRADAYLKVISLTGKKSAVETAEAAIKQLDVPAAAQKDIELTVYFVVGADGPGAPSDTPIPQEIQSTVTTLKSTFPYKNYTLLDALSLRSRAGTGGETTGQLAGARMTLFSVHSVSVEGASGGVEGNGSMIRIDRMHAGLRVPKTAGPNKTETSIPASPPKSSTSRKARN